MSFHHGGGVGIGYSLHAGMVIVADGTPAEIRAINRVGLERNGFTAAHGYPPLSLADALTRRAALGSVLYLGLIALLGIGIAMTMSPMTSAAMNAVPVQKAGIASGVLSMFRMVGGSLGVAVTGAIAFVGLIVPHLCRPFVGHSPSRLLVPSAIGGALLGGALGGAGNVIFSPVANAVTRAATGAGAGAEIGRASCRERVSSPV